MKRFSRALPASLAALVLAACQGPLPGAARPAASGTASLSVRPVLDRQLQSVLASPAISHLVLKLFVLQPAIAGDLEQPATANGRPIEKDVAGDHLADAVTFSGLKRQTTYRVKAYAYQAVGRADADLISTQDADSVVTIEVGNDDTPPIQPLKVKLKDVNVSLKLESQPINMPVGLQTVSGTPLDVTQLASSQTSGRAAYDAKDDEFLVVWVDNASGTQDVRGCRVTGTGAPLGRSFGISSQAGDQTAPAVTYDAASGSFLVAWQDGRTATSQIYAQRVAATGSLVGDELPVAPSGASQTAPAIAGSGSGCFVTWQATAAGEDDVYGAMVDMAAGLSGTPLAIAATPGVSESTPTVAYDPTGQRYLVVWDDTRNGGTNHDLYGQVVLSDGTLSGSAMPICTAPRDQTHPVLAHGTTGYLVAWQQQGLDIQGQPLSNAGSTVGEVVTLCSAPDVQQAPAIAYNTAAHEYFVAWEDHRNLETSGLDVYGQRVDEQGAVIGSAAALNFAISTAAGAQHDASLAYDPTHNHFLAAWTSAQPDASTNVNGQFIDSFAKRP